MGRVQARGVTAITLTVVLLAAACTGSSKKNVPQGTGPNTPYVDVTEKIAVALNSDGSVNGSPTQTTELSGAGQGMVTVTVPLSSNNFNPDHGAPKPTFANGMATFDLDYDGSKVHKYTSDFTKQVPLVVEPTYQLNGAPITVDGMRGKSGTLNVSYKVTNVAQQSVPVSFIGFNGQPQSDTITAPLPILAHLAVTLPGDATNIDAPGATTSVDHSGTHATWLFELVPPLGPLTQTFSYSMYLSKAAVPKASIEADVIVPSQQPDGKAAQESAKAVGEAQAAADTAMVNVQGDVASLQALQAQLVASNNSSSNDAVTGLGSGAQGTLSTNLSDDVATAASNLTNSLQALSDEIATASTNAEQQSNDLLATSRTAESAAKLANTVTAEATTAADSAQAVGAAATDGEDAIAAVQADLDAFPPPLKLTPEWLRTKAHLDIAAAKAHALVKLSHDVADGATHLAADVKSLESANQAAAAAAQEQVTGFETSVLSKLQQGVTGALDATTAGSTDLETKTDAMQASVSKAGDSLDALVAEAHSKLDAALVNADAAVRSGIDSAQAGVAQSADSARSALDKANSDYAQLLAIETAAMDNALPAGNATGARTQSGHYHYDINGS
jgi:hypothetical protein